MKKLVRSITLGKPISPDILIVCGLGLFCFLTRIPRLTILPVFGDEAAYLHWAWVINRGGPNMAYYDGLPPLIIWLISLSQRFFSSPLVAGRFISVLAGALSSVGVYFIGRALYSRTVGAVASILYILCPFAFFHDRMALLYSLLGMFGIYSLLFSILVVRESKVAHAFCMGALLGLAIITRQLGLLFFLFPLLVILVEARRGGIGRSQLTLFGLSLLVAVVFFCLVYLDPIAERLLSHVGGFLFSPKELLGFPLETWKYNVSLAFSSLNRYLTWPLFMIVLVSFYGVFRRRETGDLFLWLAGFVPMLGLVVGGKILLSRYFFLFVPPLLVLAANQVVWAVNQSSSPVAFGRGLPSAGILKWIIIGALVLLSIPGVVFDSRLIVDPASAPFIYIDRIQYIEGPCSGYGLPEALQYLRDEARGKRILVVTEPGTGTTNMPYLFLSNEPNIEVAVWMGWHYVSLAGHFAGKPAYAILLFPAESGRVFRELNPEARSVKVFYKPGRKYRFEIYKLMPRG